jgi:FAD/FMN-containing dehydrogenase
VPRGAGLSYTGGVVPRAPGVVIDTEAMAQITVNADDLTAIVGAGCSWQSLSAALKPLGLRTAAAPPISGSHSTIGGAASQGISGSEGIVGVTVVLADGEIVRTGSATTPGGRPFWRHYGPDLTGLFIGDCGAFGVKTEIVLRLLPPAQKRFASFGMAQGRDVVATIARIQRGPGGKTFAFDRARAEGATGSMDLGEAVRTVAAVAGRAGSLTQAMKDVMGMRRAKGDLEDAPWSLHLSAEGSTDAIADAQLAAMRRVCLDAGGTEIPPAVPQALDARPFSVRGMVGQDGERWVPVHGYFPLSTAGDCMVALEALFAERAGELSKHGVRVNWLLMSTGAAITMEPMFYWRDALDPLHMKFLSERNRARFGGFPAAPEARDFVRGLRIAVRDVMDRHGATHNQIGRFYVPPRGDMLARIKAVLDPAHRMNPGVMGL